MYFVKLGEFLNIAERKGLIQSNPMKRLENDEKPKNVENVRGFLTLEELSLLSKYDTKRPMAKQMFMFGCFTGLRYSDICRVTWNMVENKRVYLKMKKTDRVISIPLSANALSALPDRNGAPGDSLVFHHIHPFLINEDIRAWIKKAGINKKISFHCSRHTFATLELTYGVDLYTVSKLLGHQDVSTTAIYAKVIDKKMEEAINMIPEI